MSEFLSRLDELKNQFLELYTDADLLEIRAQLDDLEEITAAPIQKSLIDGLKSSILKQQLVNSQHATYTWKHFFGIKSNKRRQKP